MKKKNNRHIIKPPYKLNFTAIDNNINNIERYIGFLEYLKSPLLTNDDDFVRFNGLIVVL